MTHSAVFAEHPPRTGRQVETFSHDAAFASATWPHALSPRYPFFPPVLCCDPPLSPQKEEIALGELCPGLLGKCWEPKDGVSRKGEKGGEKRGWWKQKRYRVRFGRELQGRNGLPADAHPSTPNSPPLLRHRQSRRPVGDCKSVILGPHLLFTCNNVVPRGWMLNDTDPSMGRSCTELGDRLWGCRVGSRCC